MKHVNKAILLGNVGSDPKIGNGVARFRLATNRVWRDKDGVKQERTTWTTCVAFGKLADIVGDYVKKGAAVHVIGYADTREYEKDGQKREAYEVIIEDLSLVSSPGASSSQGSGQRNQAPAPSPSRQQSSSSRTPAPQHRGEVDGDFNDAGFDDYPL
ncbi:MAG: hypothetical protein BGP25_05510 [Lysobacterales bacterium 63-13]|nr:MAG: hypothetical protein BGP25_05510 [Xanthomonadales bacterium 63-13]